MTQDPWQSALYEAPVTLAQSEGAAASAVLVVISSDTAPVMVLTRRSQHLKKHAGQISFPGGRVDQSDSGRAATAIREAQEEIGLSPMDSEVVGYLPDMLTGTGFVITPVVARSQLRCDEMKQRLVANPQEVDEILFAPLSVVLSPQNFDQFTRDDFIQDGGTAGQMVRWKSWRVRLGDQVIWGATAAILHHWAIRLSSLS